MKKKKAIVIGAVTVAVVAVIAICLIFILRYENDRESIEILDSLGEIEYLEYTYHNETYVLIKESGRWEWEDNPALLILEENKIDNEMTETVQFLKNNKFKKAGDLKNYGLDDSNHIITLKDAGGKEVIIYITNSMESNYYAISNGKESIYIITDSLAEVVENLNKQRKSSETLLDALTAPTERKNYSE